MGVLKVLGILAQIFISIPKIASILEKLIDAVKKQLEIKARREREKEIEKARILAKEEHDASGLEKLLNRRHKRPSSRKKL